jgi:large subunit ribosomal protein L18
MSEYLTRKSKQKRSRRKRSHMRVRNRVRGTADRPRLAVFKSARHLYAQVIDDDAGRTLAQASTLDPEVRDKIDGATGNVAAAKMVGTAVAERAKKNGIEQVVFDRGGFIFHGKVKAIAEAAREHGLKF